MKTIANSSDVYVKGVKFQPKVSTVSVHKLDLKCALQLGDPQGKKRPGIVFGGVEVLLAKYKTAKASPAWGELYLIQNVKYAWRRTPPVTPDPQKKLTHECAGSNGTWQLDGDIPYQKIVRKCLIGYNRFDGTTGIPVDSPGVFLEQGKVAFEDVTADSQFRTYLIWDVGNVKHVLARVDWSWKGRAAGAGAQQAQCASQTLPDNWYLVPKSNAAPPPQVLIGLAAQIPAPVTNVAAVPTAWSLC